MKSWPLAAGLGLFLLASVTYHAYRVLHESVECEMTYMHPSYTEVELRSVPEPGRYRLYRFRETAIPEKQKTGELENAPVLFLPGNSGSFRQVRSLASETARQFSRPSSNQTFDLDWFAVDFKEEWSAFDGRILVHQTTFVVRCLKWLQSRYTSHSMGITIVGHSMGGLVALAALSNAIKYLDIDRDAVGLVITLASPHSRAPLMTQPAMARFYASLQSRAGSLHVPTVSISGGWKDLQVPSSMVLLPGAQFAIQQEMCMIPGVWVSADHQCIVWCNQLVVHLSSLVLSWVDVQNQLAAVPVPEQDRSQRRIGVLHNHLLRPSALGSLDNAVYKPKGVLKYGACMSPFVDDGVLQDKQIFLSGDELHLKAGDLKGRLSGGRRWHWEVNNIPSREGDRFVFVAAGVSPCSSVRLWIVEKATSRWVEKTAQLAPLPPASQEGKTEPWSRKRSREVLSGRDYFLGATWAIVLEHSSIGQATHIVLQLDEPHMPAAFFLHAGLISDQDVCKTPVHLGWKSIFSPVDLPRNHCLLTQVHVDVPLWISSLIHEVEVSDVRSVAARQYSGATPKMRGVLCHWAVQLNKCTASKCVVLLSKDSICQTSVMLNVHLQEISWGLVGRESGAIVGICAIVCLTAAVRGRDIRADGVRKVWNSRASRYRATKFTDSPSAKFGSNCWKICRVQVESFLARHEAFCGGSEARPSARWLLAAVGMGLVVRVLDASLSPHVIWASKFGYPAVLLDAFVLASVVCASASLVAVASLLMLSLLLLIDACTCPLRQLRRFLEQRFPGRTIREAALQAHSEGRRSALEQTLWMLPLSVLLAALHPGVATVAAAAGAFIACLHPSGCHRYGGDGAWLMAHFCGTCLWMPSLIAWLRLDRKFRYSSSAWECLMMVPCVLHGWGAGKAAGCSGAIEQHRGPMASCFSLIAAAVLGGRTFLAVYVYSGVCALELLLPLVRGCVGKSYSKRR